MSELKAYYVPTRSGNAINCYIKDEADKVLEEKDKELRHQKYKRCLSESKYWLAVSYQCVDDKHRQRAVRHRHQWLELAKKFEEANK